MAVENKYVDPDNKLANDKLASAAHISGNAVHSFKNVITVAAADDNGSIYRFGKGLSPNLMIKSIKILNDAITGGTDYDIGLYKTETGDVVDKDAFLDGASMASARAIGSELNGMTALADIKDTTKQLWEIAGDSEDDKPDGYDLALTANTVGTAAGDIVIEVEYIRA